MFALVKFTDESHRICPMKNVTVQQGTNCIVKYSGAKYEAELLASDETRERLKEIEETVVSGKLLANKKKQSYQKPKIINVTKVIPKGVKEYCEQNGLSASKTNQLTDIELSITDPKIGFNENVSLEHSLVVESSEQNSVSDVTGTVIEESDVNKNPDKSIDEIHTVSNIELSIGDSKIGFNENVSREHSSVVESTDQNSLDNVTGMVIEESDVNTTPDESIDEIHTVSNIELSIGDSKIGFNENVSREHSSVVESTDQNSLDNVTGMVIEESDVNTNPDESIDEIHTVSNIELSIGDSKIGFNENVSREHSSVVESTDQNSLYDVTGTVIEESDANTNSDKSIDKTYTVSNIGVPDCNSAQDILIGIHAETFSSDCNGNLKTGKSDMEQTYSIGSDHNLQNITYNTQLNDSEALLSGVLDQQKLDVTPSNCLSNSLLTAADSLFPSAIFTSTPETFQDNEAAKELRVTKENRCPEPEDSDTDDSNNTERHDPSYKPQEDVESDLTSDAESATDLVRDQGQNAKSTNNSCDVSDRINISVAKNIPGSTRCNDDDLCIEKSRGRCGDKKYNFCIYCHTKQKKISRHLELKHSDEEDVKKFLVLPKNSIERRKIIAIIRKKGNFLFNTQTEYNDGELIVSRRPNPKFDRSGRDFAACAQCKAFYSKNSLRMHVAKCTGRSSKKHRTVMVMSKCVVARIHSRASDTVINEIFPPLREDEVVRSIRYDELIIIYANKMGEKYDQARNYEMVRQSLRLLGRFLLTMRRLNKEITDLSSVYDPKFCDDTVKAIIIESKLMQSAKSNVTPAVASHLGTLLKKIGSILINECIKKHDTPKKKHTKDFVKLLTEELSLSINRRVVESQTQIKRRKKIQLPATEDVKKLCLYLDAERKKAYQNLQQNFSGAAWMELAETTLTSIQLFNRRRAGEIERTLIEDFNSFQALNVDTEKDLFNSLSKENQALAKKYVRFAIRGKLNRTVSVLLNNHLLQCIKLLLSHRKTMKISSQNPYVFGLPGEIKPRYKHLRACVLMRKFSSKCGATHPERLRGTKLRKHIATICISLNLSDNEVTDLANYMGHAEKIHKDIYRQPLVNREILRMSKLLEVAQGANTELNDDDDDTDLEDEELEHDSEDDDVRSSHNDTNRNHQESSLDCKRLNSTKLKSSGKGKRFSSPYGTITRKPWTDQEKTKVLELFGGDLQNKKLPSLKTIHEAILEHPCLQNRTSPQIKTWLHNQTRGKKRKLYGDD